MRTPIAAMLASGLLLHAPSAIGQVEPGRIAISEARGLQDWELDGNGQWRVRGDVLVLERAGVPGGPIRRPAALAIYKGVAPGDFSFEVEIRSTAPADLLVRDILLIFGYRSPAEFYYVHLSAKTDAVHNGIFLVNNSDRRRIDSGKGVARLLDQDWHRVRLERRSGAGTIEVFFDGDRSPVLTAVDRTLASGRVGVGSFDEIGEFRSFQLRAPAR